MRLGGEIGSASQSAVKLCVVVVMSSEVLLGLGEVPVGSVRSAVGFVAAPTCSGVMPVMPWTNSCDSRAGGVCLCRTCG